MRLVFEQDEYQTALLIVVFVVVINLLTVVSCFVDLQLCSTKFVVDSQDSSIRPLKTHLRRI